MKRYARALLALLAAAVLLTWIAVAQMPDGRLHVFFLDVVGGQGILLRTPSGRCVLIDGGTQSSSLMAALGRHLPFWQRTLHAVVATHQGYSALLPLIDASQRYRVITALGPAAGSHPTSAYQRWRDVLADHQTPYVEAQTGTVLDLGDDVLVHVVGVGDRLVLRITYNQLSLLLPGSDASALAGVDETVIALPYGAASALQMPQSVKTTALILLTGAQRPSPPGVPALANTQVFSTAALGSLELVSDGHRSLIHPFH